MAFITVTEKYATQPYNIFFMFKLNILHTQTHDILKQKIDF